MYKRPPAKLTNVNKDGLGVKELHNVAQAKVCFDLSDMCTKPFFRNYKAEAKSMDQRSKNRGMGRRERAELYRKYPKSERGTECI